MTLHRNPVTTRHSMLRLRRPRQRGAGGFLAKRRRTIALLTALVMPAAFALQLGAMSAPAGAAPAATGNGFVVTPGDLTFILKQIKIAERHATTLTASSPAARWSTAPVTGSPMPSRCRTSSRRTACGPSTAPATT